VLQRNKKKVSNGIPFAYIGYNHTENSLKRKIKQSLKEKKRKEKKLTGLSAPPFIARCPRGCGACPRGCGACLSARLHMRPPRRRVSARAAA